MSSLVGGLARGQNVKEGKAVSVEQEKGKKCVQMYHMLKILNKN